MHNEDNLDNIQDLVPIFADFKECTEYFYDELGKLEEVPNLTNRDRKKLKKCIMSLFHKHLGLLKTKDKAQRKKEIASVNKTLAELRNVKRNTNARIPINSAKQLPPTENVDKKLLTGEVESENAKPAG